MRTMTLPDLDLMTSKTILNALRVSRVKCLEPKTLLMCMDLGIVVQHVLMFSYPDYQVTPRLLASAFHVFPSWMATAFIFTSESPNLCKDPAAEQDPCGVSVPADEKSGESEYDGENEEAIEEQHSSCSNCLVK